MRRLCDEFGAVMIMDEVQTGLGRCGAVWGINTYGVVPDSIVTAKGLSGGLYPTSAILYRKFLTPFLHANPFIHISTFGGSEAGCWVALEVLNVLEEPGFLDHVRRMAGSFREGLGGLQKKHAGVLREVRQRGLMMGLKMADPACGPLMTLAGFRHGLLAIYANHDPSVLQLLPPLIIQAHEAEEVVGALDRMLAWVEEALETVNFSQEQRPP